MKAVVLKRFGEPGGLVLETVADPVPEAGQVLVRVEAAGVNFAETMMRRGQYAVLPELPAVLGSEVVGVVEAVGAGAQSVRAGDRVAAALFAGGVLTGGYAEFAVVDAALAVPVPAELSSDIAVALPVQGLTAAYLLQRNPVKGRTVLVMAAAGGVGQVLVQLARRAGAERVIATASTKEKLIFALDLGADTAVDNQQDDWADQVRQAIGSRGVDVIFDSAGGETTREALKALAPLGESVLYGATGVGVSSLDAAAITGLIFANQSVRGFALPSLLTSDGLRSALSDLYALAVAGDLRVHIGGRYPLADAARAHRDMEGRQTYGKLVLHP